MQTLSSPHFVKVLGDADGALLLVELADAC